MKIKKSVGSHIFDTFNYLFMGFLVLSMLVPFIHVAAVSMSSAGPVIQNKVTIWPVGFNVESYKKILTDPYILTSYKNTLFYTAFGTFINLILTAMTAYALAKKKMIFRNGFTMIIMFTMIFNGGMIPNYLLVQKLKLIDTLWAVVLPGAISTWNLMVMRQFFMAIPESLEESAMIDGCNDIQIFYKIILPLSKASLATIGLFYAVGHWNSFFLPLIYLHSKSKYPIQIILRSMVIEGNLQSVQTQNASEAATVVQNIKYTVIMVATLPILAVYPFIQKYFVKGSMVGSVKG
jgi:putative aldouronate transport system permease protein